MRSFNSQAIVIKSINYGEADKIYNLFTKEHGKVSAIAKGVRKIKSRKSGSLDLFSYSKIFLAEGKNMYVVTQAEVINSFSGIKKNLLGSSLLYLVGETLNKLLAEGQEHADVFNIVVLGLSEINMGPKGLTGHNRPIEVQSSFENLLIEVLRGLGYWSNKFPTDLNYIKNYIESLSDAKLSSYSFKERVDEVSMC